MTQDINDFVTPSCDLLALGEPTHQEPAFGWVRNELFARLVERGFRSIALETDRVAALAVNDYVQGGAGDLDTVMNEGFSHDVGAPAPNRRLITWMRAHNEHRPPKERLAFHGFDTPGENYSTPSPRGYLEHARAYLELDVDISGLTGADERWSRAEAVMDPAMSPGATAEAEKLRLIADDMLTSLWTRAPELIAATSPERWLRARTHLVAGIGLLRYHHQSATQPADPSPRVTALLAARDALMAQNLLDIRNIEAERGATLVFSHNLHLQRCLSSWRLDDVVADWWGAGTIVAPLLGGRYRFVAGSLGRSAAIGLQDPDPDTYEGQLQGRIPTWGLAAATTLSPARTRTDTTPRQGYFPLDRAMLDGADAILHVADGSAAACP
ncbi:erythromycin esterase family protein [Streptomyces sp. FXJ1.172]|uniref:erythromycin esterase family protein n=1 Tax=Streptomyces sp. FXJ1.172 TaxID=710705 RepID=UPI0007D004C5|nr:erythromycin esterase family protein [Streptomyces sp. FXJ1.172]WEO93558.1 erythromycin esterase family protein [Streptomyces sp. FXJ1.172]